MIKSKPKILNKSLHLIERSYSNINYNLENYNEKFYYIKKNTDIAFSNAFGTYGNFKIYIRNKSDYNIFGYYFKGNPNVIYKTELIDFTKISSIYQDFINSDIYSTLKFEVDKSKINDKTTLYISLIK